MSQETQRKAVARTTQDLVIVGVRECQNHYASLVQQLLTRTDEFDHADWIKTSVTVNADAATAPDGTATADEVIFNATNDALTQIVAGHAVANQAYTGSIWLRVPSGSQTVLFQIYDDDFIEVGGAILTVTTTWQRFWAHKLFSGAATGDLLFRLIRDTADTVTTLYVWRANCTRNPGDLDREIGFPSVKRVAEAAATLSVNASRCQATDAGVGSRCEHSRPTCQDPDNFNRGSTWETTPSMRGIREFRFCRQDASLPFPGENVVPALLNYDSAPQEIDAERVVTMNERVKFEFRDFVATGVWSRRQQQRGGLVNTARGGGTFWRRFRAIYANYANPDGYVVRKNGYVEAGATEADFVQRGRYLPRNLELIDDRRVRLECSDRLQLTRKELPAVLSDTNVLTEGIDAAAVTIKLADMSEVTTPADNATSATPDYKIVLELDPESVFGAPEKVNVTAVNLTAGSGTVQRGRWGTIARAHPPDTVVREVLEFGTERLSPSGVPLGKSLVDISVELLRMSGIAAADIDTAAAIAERDTWYPATVDPTTGFQEGAIVRRTVTEKTKIEEMLAELRETAMLFMWVNPLQLVTFKAFAPPLPGTALSALTEGVNLLAGTITVDDQDETRLTRGLIAWDLKAGEPGDKPTDFNRNLIYVRPDEESPDYYGEQRPGRTDENDQRARVILSKWLLPADQANAEAFITKIVDRFARGAVLLRAHLEIRDDAVEVGDLREVRSSRLQAFDGSTAPRTMFIVKKKPRVDGRIEIDALDAGLFQRFFFYAPDAAPDYSAATDADKEYGYLSDDDGKVGTPAVDGYAAW